MKKSPVQLKVKPQARELEEREFIDIPGAATWAYCSKQHVRRLLTEGKLTRYKFGARTLIKFSELHALVKPS